MGGPEFARRPLFSVLPEDRLLCMGIEISVTVAFSKLY